MSRLTLLLAGCELDESLTWWWLDNRRSMVACSSWEKQVSVAPRLYRPSIFFFPPPLTPTPLCWWSTKSPAVYILSPELDGLWRENRGYVNRLSQNWIKWMKVSSRLKTRRYTESFMKYLWLSQNGVLRFWIFLNKVCFSERVKFNIFYRTRWSSVALCRHLILSSIRRHKSCFVKRGWTFSILTAKGPR